MTTRTLFATIGVLFMMACGSVLAGGLARPDLSASTAAAEPAVAAVATPVKSGGSPRLTITSCAEVIAPPRDTEVDTVHDREREIIEFWFGDSVPDGRYVQRHFAIAYRSDPTCQDNPRLRTLITHVLDTTADTEADGRDSQRDASSARQRHG